MSESKHHLDGMTPLQKAVLALKRTQERLDALERRAAEPIAVVGLGCRFPGDADSPDAFWRLLCEGRDAVTEISPRRWPASINRVEVGERQVDIGRGGFLTGIDRFDYRFFGMTQQEADQTDPQHRILLEVTWEALEDAGLVPERLRGGNCGVFLGIASTDYGINLARDVHRDGPWLGSGTALCIAANRLSYQFDWRGPSLALDTACSSSLLAAHLACRSLRDGECDLAVVAGSNLLLSPFGSRNLARSGFFSASGRIRAFDRDADGYVRSDGVGVVVLKRQSDVRPGSELPYTLIRGTAVNQDGQSNGLTAPNRKRQEELLSAACNVAKLQPEDVDYVETQGTGTTMGDSLEASALGAVYGGGRAPDDPLVIGSVKTNIGHTEAASGVASLIKLALALRHRTLPPSIHFRHANPAIPLADWRLKVQTELSPWPRRAALPRAGVSAFGFGGTNVHALLEGIDNESGAGESVATSPGLLLLSARSETALAELAERYRVALEQGAGAWGDLCYSAAVHRQHHEWRLALAATDAVQGATRLAAYLNGERQRWAQVGRSNPDQSPRLALFFGGDSQGSGGSADAMRSWGPVFASAVEEGERQLSDAIGAAPGALDAAAAERVRLLVRYRAGALAWRQLGIQPRCVGGAGVGAFAAAVEAGVLEFGRAARVLADRAVQLTLTDGGRPSTTLVIDGDQWLGQQPVTLSVLAEEGAPTRRKLEQICPQGVIDLDDACVHSAGRNDRPAAVSAAGASAQILSELYTLGVRLDWSQLMQGRFVRLPTYPWQRESCWVEGGALGDLAGDDQADSNETEPVPGGEHPQDGDVLAIRPRPDLYTPFEEPGTPLEQALSQAWSEVLRVAPVGLHDNYLELGGDSLQGMMLLNRLQDILNQTVDTALMLQSMTVAELAVNLRREYPNDVLRIFPDEPGVEAVEPGGAEQPRAVDRDVAARARELLEARMPADAGSVSGEPGPPAGFVLAPSHSGAALLRTMLAGNTGLFVPGELDLLGIDTLDQWQQYGELAGRWRAGLLAALTGAFGWGPEQAEAELERWIRAAKPSRDLYAQLQQAVGDRLLVGAMPGYGVGFSALTKAECGFRDARYIHLVRHPCDSILASLDDVSGASLFPERGAALGLKAAQVAELGWLLGHENILRFVEQVPAERVHRVRFESLVERPQQEMERLAAFLGVDYQAAMARPYAEAEGGPSATATAGDRAVDKERVPPPHRGIDPAQAGRWRREAPEMALGEPARELAARLGYGDLPILLADLVGGERASAESRRAEELLDRLDDLSDEEVELLLQQQMAAREDEGGV